MSKHERFESMFPRDGGRRQEPIDDPMDELVGDDNGSIEDYENAEEDGGAGFRLRREVKLGLALLGLLALVLVGTFVWRSLRGGSETVADAEAGASPTASSDATEPTKKATTGVPRGEPQASATKAVAATTATTNDAGPPRGAKSDPSPSTRNAAASRFAAGDDESPAIRAKTNGKTPDRDDASRFPTRADADARTPSFRSLTGSRLDSAAADTAATGTSNPFSRDRAPSDALIATAGGSRDLAATAASADRPASSAGRIGLPRVAAPAADTSAQPASEAGNPLRNDTPDDATPRSTQPGTTPRGNDVLDKARGESGATGPQDNTPHVRSPLPETARLGIPESRDGSGSAAVAAGSAQMPGARRASPWEADAPSASAPSSPAADRRNVDLAAARDPGSSPLAARAAAPLRTEIDPRRNANALGAASPPPRSRDGAADRTASGAADLGESTGLASGDSLSPRWDRNVPRDTNPNPTASSTLAGSPLARTQPAASDVGAPTASTAPAASTLPREPAEAASPANRADSSGRRTYVVQEGDSLVEIARYELGQATRWTEIYQLNRGRLGGRPHEPVPGTQLILPDDARGAGGLTQRPGTALNR